MKQYLDLVSHVLEHGNEKVIALEPEQKVCLVTKCVSI